MTEKAVLKIGEASYDLPILKGSTGPDVIDVRKLYGETEMFTFDPAFTSTASCESKITYIDGDAGVLLHRGYPIEQLADQSGFLEVSYLLLNSKLPTADELADFENTITRHTMLPTSPSTSKITTSVSSSRWCSFSSFTVWPTT